MGSKRVLLLTMGLVVEEAVVVWVPGVFWGVGEVVLPVFVATGVVGVVADGIGVDVSSSSMGRVMKAQASVWSFASTQVLSVSIYKNKTIHLQKTNVSRNYNHQVILKRKNVSKYNTDI